MRRGERLGQYSDAARDSVNNGYSKVEMKAFVVASADAGMQLEVVITDGSQLIGLGPVLKARAC